MFNLREKVWFSRFVVVYTARGDSDGLLVHHDGDPTAGLRGELDQVPTNIHLR